jgi:tetratricopeptide (TPR) repeat protein
MSLKPIIKSTREAIDRKDYPYALQLCTDALEFEPENYWLLVFRAVALGALGDLEKGLLDYGKAAKVQPDNPLAFQVTNMREFYLTFF